MPIFNPENNNTNTGAIGLNDLIVNVEDEGEGLEELDDGSVLVDIGDDDADDLTTLPNKETIKNHYQNLVEELDEETLTELTHTVFENVDHDKESRGEWMDTISKGMDLLGLKVEEKNNPFQGACSAQHPLLMESAVKFQSKASLELLPAKGPVQTTVLGDVTPEKEEQAMRVKNHMNYQITEQMTEYYPDTEKMLFYTAIIGSSFKKTYYDAHQERPISEFVPADQFLVSDVVSDLYRAEWYTHILYKTKNQLNADFAAGLYKKPENFEHMGGGRDENEVQEEASDQIGMTISLNDDDEDVHTLYEHHIEIHIPELEERDKGKDFELASPYIITVDKASQKILGIRRNWKPKDDEKRRKIVKFTHYGFVPGFGFYHYGFLHLLGNIQLSLTSSLRSLIDSGQFANLQGGFKLKGVRIANDQDPISPGEFKEIEAGVTDINKALYPLPFKEPSNVLYQMLQWLDGKGQKFADSTEQVIADSTNQGPVGTTMALLDASTKFFSAIHKRLHRAQKHELKLIASINAETLDEENLLYNISNENMAVKRADYNAKVDVTPISDPNISSNAHRMTKAQTLLDMAIKTPEVHDMREVMKRVYINMDYGDVDKLLPAPEEAERQEPFGDIQSAIKGEPIKAFEGQDHQAHITVKQGFLADPTTGGSEFMSSVAQAVQANIQEHMFLQFKSETQALAQQTQGDQGQAAQQLAQMKIQQLQQQQGQQDEASMMLAQAEVMGRENEAREQQFEAKHKTAELELDKEKLDLEKLKTISNLEQSQEKLKNDIDKIVVTKTLDAMIKEMTEEVQKTGVDINQ